MKWYAASIIMSIIYKEGEQDTYPLMENVVLLCADSDDEAYAKASERALAYEGDADGSFKWNNRPAKAVFAGTRKIIKCMDFEKRPGDGTEITYSIMEVDTVDNIKALVDGESACVRYEE